MLNKLLATKDDFSTTTLRVTLGVVMFPHGAQKLLGWFGGHGFSGTMHHFTETMGIPYLFALLAVLAESFGALGLIAGLFTRVAAFGIGATIGVAALMGHVKYGFFMNWFGTQAGEGFEYHLLVIGMALALVIAGGGRWSLDRLIAHKS
ncbi:putative membrane protein YphA, DoxX/SURF4 family [Desulfuromonas soudanensis]|uniref:Putative membrane protein YphA, DoxX/SURF4 family n=1 Tax=Desulfuromonas soudanensis TaxID=1603606 RepID=A0A0M5IZL5_9BACT|nr:DoxX family protein [Desulfuromonas soudanensis]ALC17856.1 putative membrane protein YphA, DoxX/SURF4 family [Desulfuromonas soudanensis]